VQRLNELGMPGCRGIFGRVQPVSHLGVAAFGLRLLGGSCRLGRAVVDTGG
jgi:hypothetical protein